MRAIQRQIVASTVWISCLVAIAGCASAPAPKPRPVQDDPTVPRTASPEEELTMIRADSEVFVAVVRAQLAGGDEDYPNHLEHLRYDPRPHGTTSGYPI